MSTTFIIILIVLIVYVYKLKDEVENLSYRISRLEEKEFFTDDEDFDFDPDNL